MLGVRREARGGGPNEPRPLSLAPADAEEKLHIIEVF